MLRYHISKHKQTTIWYLVIIYTIAKSLSLPSSLRTINLEVKTNIVLRKMHASPEKKSSLVPTDLSPLQTIQYKIHIDCPDIYKCVLVRNITYHTQASSILCFKMKTCFKTFEANTYHTRATHVFE